MSHRNSICNENSLFSKVERLSLNNYFQPDETPHIPYTPNMLLKLNGLIANNLFSEPSAEDLFNPYSTSNSALDVPNAHLIRRANLTSYICDRREPPSVLILMEAPGPWGCRFTGVPITSEQQLLDPSFPLKGSQTSLGAEPHKEYSASIYWKTLLPFYRHIFTWNTVPFHPYKMGAPLSIRTPRTSEIDRFVGLLGQIVDVLSPQSVIAVGRKAESALKKVGCEAVYVRHPSQGGATLFAQGITKEMKRLGLGA